MDLQELKYRIKTRLKHNIYNNIKIIIYIYWNQKCYCIIVKVYKLL